jgi:hypothetical protein
VDNRTRYYNVVTVDGINERDLSGAPWNYLTIKRSTQYYRAREKDGARMDLVSYEYYGTPYLWWFVLLVNKIVNPLEEVSCGDIGDSISRMLIVDTRDLYDFYDERKKYLING